MARLSGKQGKATVRKGDKWGRLECTAIGVASKSVEVGDGISSIKPSEYFSAKCDCGTVIDVWVDEFRGKTRMKDCGCGLSALDGVNVPYSITGPIKLLQDLTVVAIERKWSRNQAAREALRIGVERLQGGSDANDDTD